MAKVGAQRAAELTGRSKSTIQRAMKAGMISYEVDNNGRRVIDVAELDRAFGLMPQDGGNARSNSAAVEAELEKATAMLEAERLKMRIRMLEDQLDMVNNQVEDLKTQRDQWQKQAQQVLITSQYSQKQAEELKEELKERDRVARLRRQREMEIRAKGGKPGVRPAAPKEAVKDATKTVVKGDNENRKTGPIEQQRQAAAAAVKNFDIQGLWQKIRGQDDKDSASAPERAAG
jgi:hypothetical protein